MREIEERTYRELSITPLTLMETAGREVAICVAKLRPRVITVVCGRGNNGGDGVVCARALTAMGIATQVILIFDEAQNNALLTQQILWARTCGVKFVRSNDLAAEVARADVVVDAILGSGARQPLPAVIAEAVETINTYARTVVAVDVPSGVAEKPGLIVHANKTVCFAAMKSEMTQLPARAACGEIHVVDIGIPSSFYAETDGIAIDKHFAALHLNHQRTLPGIRNVHKGTFGHVVIWGGGAGKSGALCLSTISALRTGAGLVTAAAFQHQALAGLPADIMTTTAMDYEALKSSLTRATAVAFGPGLGTDENAARMLDQTLQILKTPAVIDADALNLLAKDPRPWKEKLGPGPRILTPHPLEFVRLFGDNVETVQNARIEQALQAARTSSTTVVLKGANTVIASSDESWGVCQSGNAELAKGGTGDVLCGIIGAFLARGLSPFVAASLGTYIQGEAGALAAMQIGEASVMASDVARLIPHVLRRFERRE